MKGKFARVNKSTPCPVCAKPDGCMIATDGTAAICLRVEKGCAKRRDGTPIKAKGDMGWLHDPSKRRAAGAKKLRAADDVPKKSTTEWRLLIKRFRLAGSSLMLRREAERLGVSPRSLERLQVGYDSGASRDGGAYTYPMFNGEMKPIGIRYRTSNGKKWCLMGSRNGLFIPEDFELREVPVFRGNSNAADIEPQTVILAPEGPTDVAALLTLGLVGIGRPSNTAGVDMLIRLLKSGPKQDVVILADHDETKFMPDGTPFWPGFEGALSTAARLLESGACARLRTCYPPGGMKDVRGWLRATKGPMEAIVHMLESAQPVGLRWLAKETARVERAKRTRWRGDLQCVPMGRAA